ncbi:hypothetical protein RINTHH_18350 [Richelia intracellularis HH01]|uniref:Uncharacterized protein n=1 Tax=Richelia intracellularis HH01 TaxID=1165094 RepID=M1X356_9NOST|nr:hypothetical protein RINTHH_18350 [Richelia intracellularis HH01]
MVAFAKLCILPDGFTIIADDVYVYIPITRNKNVIWFITHNSTPKSLNQIEIGKS